MHFLKRFEPRNRLRGPEAVQLQLGGREARRVRQAAQRQSGFGGENISALVIIHFFTFFLFCCHLIQGSPSKPGVGLMITMSVSSFTTTRRAMTLSNVLSNRFENGTSDVKAIQKIFGFETTYIDFIVWEMQLGNSSLKNASERVT
jgi:hypothetical protein